MRATEVESIENMFESVVGAMKQMSSAMKVLSRRISRLEAENKELRSLWSQCETMIIEHKSDEERLRENIANMLLTINRKHFPPANNPREET